MKKFLFAVVACVSFFFNANAQVCKISDSNDNVEVFSTVFANDNKTSVEVTLSNDSKDISANVTVVVRVTYGNGHTKDFTGKGLALPNQSTKISVKIDPKLGSSLAREAEVVEIKGTKCK